MRPSIEPFDQRAAIELAVMLRQELGPGRKLKDGAETWAKLKYDRQIVAIAKVCNATALYSEDDDIHTLAGRFQIPAFRIRDLTVPPADQQTDLLLDRPEEPGAGPGSIPPP